ncbi:MAG TPA: hypothetical protein VFW24_06485 [Acidimicrobiales bacterium]|nr:hypothetical protein [Acidimicrobiales bacterium]
MRRIGAAVVLVTVCVVGGVVLMLIPLSIPGAYPPVSGPPVASCRPGLAGTGFGTLLASAPDVQLHPRDAFRYEECHDAAVQRAVQAGGLAGLGLVATIVLFVWRPGLLEQAAPSRRRGPAGGKRASLPTSPVGMVASVIGVGCLLGGFLWIASSA